MDFLFALPELETYRLSPPNKMLYPLSIITDRFSTFHLHHVSISLHLAFGGLK